MNKADIVDVLEDIAVLLELKGENPFKIRAYSTGARALETMEDDLGELIESGKLAGMRGIGSALVEKIETLHASGELAYYTELRASVAPGLIEMLDIPGLGGKKVKKLHDALGVESIDALKAACESGAVEALKGFGKKSAEKILKGIANRAAYAKRHHWWTARAVAEPILAGLQALPQVERAEVAGSLRRLRETVGDLDFIVASSEPQPIMDWFVTQPMVVEVTAHGTTKSSVRYEGGLQADLRVVPAAQFAFALHHFTGSKEHNVAMRQRALSRGYSLSEWGLKRIGDLSSDKASDTEGDELRALNSDKSSSLLSDFNDDENSDFKTEIKGDLKADKLGDFSSDSKDDKESDRISDALNRGIDSEGALFEFLGLSEIAPELREGLGEIEAAESGGLPTLVTSSDIRGVFHNHTTASDGRGTIEEMAAAAEALGWDYLGLADHSKASYQANGLDDERVLRMVESIRAFNESGASLVHVFSGIECDILPDGSLDLEDSTLDALDYAVMSVHSSFSQSEEEMTARVIRAIEHPATTMIGHPTGRILLRREPYKVDLQKVIDAAIANRVIIEINANPRRLDMDWRLWRRAAERGLMCSINPDAHSTDGLSYFDAGVNIARKGWLKKEQVLNSRDCAGVVKWLTERQ
ncbi:MULTISPECIES: PHP domain-containing protein [unclassified Lentimonas]|uniref:PHP domain-containing protein n=1 Tax=unclassified Lentimonas TaxID=2630993 RepID=UPI00132483F0|nr:MULTISPECIES: PHP domain-containing protein [unclassified Lentimonas]CAA6676580.1 DNA polymerase X family [Lentimonas sp. CC4]CAA6684756.1 DNA polymerase X family [Lentimonas sp. CC6]CAA7075392.1 DNA polymerase X family [Lentimonas sp. CC4]CAA7168945.1 DNA polymerase X family [Lentimonas sp. CC21]CAA7182199.1 DNA polymerase X family [Lentimonas sp. CC8]